MEHSIEVRQIAGRFRSALGPRGNLVRRDGRILRVDDAVATAFVEQELQYLKAQTYDITRLELRARDFIPVDHEPPSGAESVAWDQYDWFGEADVVENYAKDFPRVDVTKARFRNGVFSLGDAYGYSVQDLRAIAMTGSRLDVARALQARRGIEAKLETIAATGLAKKGITGFANDANVTLLGTALSWSMSSDPFDLLDDLSRLVQAIPVASKQVWKPDTLLLPTKAFQVLNLKRFSQFNPESVLSAFLKTDPYIKQADIWTKLDGAGAGGVDRLVVYKHDPTVLTLAIPQEYEEMPPEVRGMEFLIHAHLRTAGVAVRYPMAMTYQDGTFDPSA